MFAKVTILLIFYGDLVYKFKRIVGKPNFRDQFKKIVKRYIRVVFLVSRDGWAALHGGATGLSAVCDCGIS